MTERKCRNCHFLWHKSEFQCVGGGKGKRIAGARLASAMGKGEPSPGVLAHNHKPAQILAGPLNQNAQQSPRNLHFNTLLVTLIWKILN